MSFKKGSRRFYRNGLIGSENRTAPIGELAESGTLSSDTQRALVRPAGVDARAAGDASPLRSSGRQQSQGDERGKVPGADVTGNEDQALSMRRAPRRHWVKANSQRSSHRDLETIARPVRALTGSHRRMSQARHRPSNSSWKTLTTLRKICTTVHCYLPLRGHSSRGSPRPEIRGRDRPK
jgi:hypothetical protein